MASSNTKPDREGFLRRLESGKEDDGETTPVVSGRKTVRIDDTARMDNDETLRFLQDAGLESSLIDASSLAALRDLCSPPEEEEEKAAPAREFPPLMEIQTNAALLRRQTSDLTQTFRRPEMDDWRTDATTAGSVDNRSDAVTKAIMDQLETQTALLMDVQRQLEELKQSVRQLQQQQQQYPVMEPPVPQAAPVPPQRHVVMQQQRQYQPAREPPVVPRQAPVVLQRQEVQPAQPPVMTMMTRIVEIVRVFWAMQRRQVILDGAMLFKVLFMILILSSRMGGRKQSATSTYRFYVGLVLVIMGFLLQSGYAKFFHSFFYKQNIPARIWRGEEINVDEAVVPPPPVAQPREAQQPDQEEERGWRHTFFGGAIPPAEPQVPDNNNRLRLLGFLQDIVYLFGSFVLSILPMWKPEAIVPPVEENQPQEEGEEGQEGDAPVEDERDAMQPLEDEDDDIYD